CLRLMKAHPDDFSANSAVAGANRLLELSGKGEIVNGDAPFHVRSMEEASDALAEKAPKEAISFAERGLDYLTKEWYLLPMVVDERERLVFWSAILHARVQLEEWEPAGRLGAELLAQLGAEIPQGVRGRVREPRARRDLALALEGLG